MEKFKCTKTGKVGTFRDSIYAGETFDVTRNIRNECVLLMEGPARCNIIVSDKELKNYGELIGFPALG